MQIAELISGKRKVAPDEAWLLSQAFGTTPQFWLKRQIEAFAIGVVGIRPKIVRLITTELSTCLQALDQRDVAFA